MFQGAEKKLQRHIAQYLRRVRKYAILEQSEITDTDYYFFGKRYSFMTGRRADATKVVSSNNIRPPGWPPLFLGRSGEISRFPFFS